MELSEREREVAIRAAKGTPLKLIAAELAISVQAVSTYLARVRRKLALSSRAELARCLLSDRPLAAPAALAIGGLTETERDVWSALAKGMSNRSIAEARGRSIRTIEKQVAAVITKLGLRSRTELLAVTPAGLELR
ncbi:MAG TPA: LuxR C-terminal-related transcriptional regulator [Polyangia bacterium]|nr:LuxR C-terminal-related transcriptional regulator [Polyangia bacterium]